MISSILYLHSNKQLISLIFSQAKIQVSILWHRGTREALVWIWWPRTLSIQVLFTIGGHTLIPAETPFRWVRIKRIQSFCEVSRCLLHHFFSLPISDHRNDATEYKTLLLRLDTEIGIVCTLSLLVNSFLFFEVKYLFHFNKVGTQKLSPISSTIHQYTLGISPYHTIHGCGARGSQYYQ